MQEVNFLRRNAEKWKQFDALLSNQTGAGDRRDVAPDTLAELFVEVTDDLSYARTFFPGSKTAAYLNELAGKAHRLVYRNRTEERSRFIRFWAREVPLAVRASWRELAISLAVFLLALAIGTVSAFNDQGFVRLILGDAYVNMTLDNIAAGDPMAVYGQMGPLGMTLGITINNIFVACFTYASGILFSIGAAYSLFKNAVMLGAFHSLFYQHHILLKSLLVIYIHGTLEISAIIIAGGAGFVLGNSFLFPGSYTRIVSLTRGARRSLKIIIGLVPVFMIAGTLEGFVTRHTLPLALSLCIILGSLSFVIWYFIVLPWRLGREVPQ